MAEDRSRMHSVTVARLQTLRGVWLRLCAAVLLGALAVLPAVGEPLTKEACDTVKSEQDTLAAAGVKEDFAKGPEWAKANLPRERLQQIRRYIELEEQLLFRCGLARLRFTPPAGDEEAHAGEAAGASAGRKVEPTAAPKPFPPASAKKAAPTPRQPSASEPATGVKPKPRPKPKIDDAYRPPPADPDADPFARQLAKPKP
jgi:hypothetical protein